MKKLLLLTIIIFSLPSLLWASEVILKSGQKIEGKIIKQTDKYVEIEDLSVGIPMTYYADEIDTVDGEKIKTTPAPLKQQVLNVYSHPVAVLNNDSTSKAVQFPTDNASKISKVVIAQQKTIITQHAQNNSLVGYWDTDCSEDDEDFSSAGGLWVQKADNESYSVSVCKPDGICFNYGKDFPGWGNLRIVDSNTFELKDSKNESVIFHRCGDQPKKIKQIVGEKSIAKWMLITFLKSIGWLILFFIPYSVGLYSLAKKCKIPHAWLAYIPIADFYLKCHIGNKPWWWAILFCAYIFGAFAIHPPYFLFVVLILPLIIVDIVVWAAILGRFHRSRWWLAAIYNPLYPLGPVIVIWYLATRKDI